MGLFCFPWVVVVLLLCAAESLTSGSGVALGRATSPATITRPQLILLDRSGLLLLQQSPGGKHPSYRSGQQSRAAGLWPGRGLEGSISLVEPDAVIFGIFGGKNIRLAVAVEIPDG